MYRLLFHLLFSEHVIKILGTYEGVKIPSSGTFIIRKIKDFTHYRVGAVPLDACRKYKNTVVFVNFYIFIHYRI
jgi:hypothetical protein